MCDVCRARATALAEELHAALTGGGDRPAIAFAAALMAITRLADATGTGAHLATLLRDILAGAQAATKTTLPRDLATLEPEGRA